MENAPNVLKNVLAVPNKEIKGAPFAIRTLMR
jgi:hypothetical protein